MVINCLMSYDLIKLITFLFIVEILSGQALVKYVASYLTVEAGKDSYRSSNYML